MLLYCTLCTTFKGKKYISLNTLRLRKLWFLFWHWSRIFYVTGLRHGINMYFVQPKYLLIPWFAVYFFVVGVESIRLWLVCMELWFVLRVCGLTLDKSKVKIRWWKNDIDLFWFEIQLVAFYFLRKILCYCFKLKMNYSEFWL